MGAAGPDVLLAHSYFLHYDRKQVRKMRPFPPLATLITASVLRRQGCDVALFDAMLSSGVGEFVERLDREPSPVVALLEDNFNFLTKMCTTRMRDAALEMIRAARARGCFVVVNGADASDVPHRYLDAGADAVIVGETEVTLPRLLEARPATPTLDVTQAVSSGRRRGRSSRTSRACRCRRGIWWMSSATVAPGSTPTAASRGTW